MWMRHCAAVCGVAVAMFGLGSCGSDGGSTAPPEQDPAAVAVAVNEAFEAQRRDDAAAYCKKLTAYARSALVKVSKNGTGEVTSYDPADCERAFDRLRLSRVAPRNVTAEQVRFEPDGHATIEEPGDTGNALSLVSTADGWQLETPFFYGR